MNKWKDMVKTLVLEKLGCKYEVVVTDIVKNNGVRKEALVITGENHTCLRETGRLKNFQKWFEV